MIVARNVVFKQILEDAVTTALKPLGFRKRANTYVKKLEELYWVIDVQRSQWNTSDQVSFTINLGVFVPNFISTYNVISGPENPKIVECCVRTRIGKLMPGGYDHWWEIHKDDIDAKSNQTIMLEVKTQVLQAGVPFLNRFTTIDQTIAYLEAPRPKEEAMVWPGNPMVALTYAAVLYHLKGDSAKCCALLNQVQEQSKKMPGREHIDFLLDRLCKTP